MRVLLDTNVLINALLSPRGAPARTYSAWRSGLYSVVASQALLDEVAAVLARPKLRRHIGAEEASAFLSDLRTGVEFVAMVPAPTLRAPDPGDDFLLQLVAAAAPDLLVTGDKALLGLVSVGRTLIVTVEEMGLVLEELIG